MEILADLINGIKGLAWPAALGAVIGIIVIGLSSYFDFPLPLDNNNVILLGGLTGTGLNGLVQLVYKLLLKESMDDNAFERRYEVNAKNQYAKRINTPQRKFLEQRLAMNQALNQPSDLPLNDTERAYYIKLGELEDDLELPSLPENPPQKASQKSPRKRKR